MIVGRAVGCNRASLDSTLTPVAIKCRSSGYTITTLFRSHMRWRPLSKEDAIVGARGAFDRVFAHANPNGAPFSSRVEKRAIIYGFLMVRPREDLATLARALAIAGQAPHLIISEVENYTLCGFEGCAHWSVNASPLPEKDEPLPWCSSIESAFYSPAAEWGAITSREMHAVVGGSERFMAALRTVMPDMDERLHGFLRTWQWNVQNLKTPDFSWIGGLLRHAYGDIEAAKLLRQYGLPDVSDSCIPRRFAISQNSERKELDHAPADPSRT
jgi:hypothetical protein